VVQELVKDIRASRSDVQEIKITLKALADVSKLKSRIERLERKVGV
jgi:hypothetical protein